jgi:hypothetical protein
MAANTTAAALGAQSCSSVLVQNDNGNSVNVLVGNSTAQYIQLTPGQCITIPCSNISLVFARSATSTANVNWLTIT